MTLENTSYNYPDPRDMALKINGVIDGGGNNTGDLTLTASAASTVITDTRVGPTSAILLMPTTANAATALSTTYISATKGSFTVTHANNAQTDRTFKYAVVGS